MTEKRSKLGLWATAVWIMGAVALLLLRQEATLKMTPNEWGDFFSGLFAPLAFLWLILGYMQQGEELRLSTEALRLQAVELKNSVEQQQALVEVTRQQVESEQEALKYERALRELESSPKFLIAPAGGTFRGDGQSSYALIITNTGAAALSITVDVALSDGRLIHLVNRPLLKAGEEWRTHLEVPTPITDHEARLTLRYKNPYGRETVELFSVGPATEKLHSDLVILPVT